MADNSTQNPAPRAPLVRMSEPKYRMACHREKAHYDPTWKENYKKHKQNQKLKTGG